MWYVIIYKDERDELQRRETESLDIEELVEVIKEISKEWGNIVVVFRS